MPAHCSVIKNVVNIRKTICIEFVDSLPIDVNDLQWNTTRSLVFFELRLFEFILYQQNYVTLTRTSDKLFVSK